eukprot:gene3710-4059_t
MKNNVALTHRLLLSIIFMINILNIRSFHPLTRGRLYRRSFSRSFSEVVSKEEDVALPPADPIDYPNFSFEIKQTVSSSKARTAILTTPHGVVETPNFVFCATKAAMKALTMEQLRSEGTQICLSNTYHLMLTPGADLVDKMGGLQKMTGWNGPMLTDSGGYQIFSMGFGSVSSEIKGKRDTEKMGWNQTLLKIDEEAATFRSYVDGSIHHLTPEKSMEIQRKLGADLIVVLDECTPFNVDKDYTKESMLRSHRWGKRCLEAFRASHTGKQALYGIVQGGIYHDLRVISTNFVNTQPFFGMAIGGSLGGTKKDMHDIVTYTRSLMRNDRPIHLLGIGGIRDIFHGVRQGIDTFDCVHPTRLGRHGGALVPASHWDEDEIGTEGELSIMAKAAVHRIEKTIQREIDRQSSVKDNIARIKAQLEVIQANDQFNEQVSNLETQIQKAEAQLKASIDRKAAEEVQLQRILSGEVQVNKKGGSAEKGKRKVREHVQLSQGRMRSDPRPIDPTCDCYTCRNFSRAYLHHLFKAEESLGGTLVTLHNVHFMNRLMRAIRKGIETDTLDEVEREFVHADLLASIPTADALGE